MKIDDLIEIIDKKLASLNKEGIVDLWNIIFPAEEHINLSNLLSDDIDTIHMLEEEIALADTKKILKVYNKLMGDELTIEDMDSDEEGWEPKEEEIDE